MMAQLCYGLGMTIPEHGNVPRRRIDHSRPGHTDASLLALGTILGLTTLGIVGIICWTLVRLFG